jgi:cell division protein FtsL
MTVIKPQPNDTLLRAVIAALLGAAALAAIALVFLYNRSVNLQHAVSGVQDDIKQLELGNAELQDKVFAIFTNGRMEAFAEAHGFVKDKNPRYFEISTRTTQWPLVSQR